MSENYGIGMVADGPYEDLSGVDWAACEESDAHGAYLEDLMRAAQGDGHYVLLGAVDKVVEQGKHVSRPSNSDPFGADSAP